MTELPTNQTQSPKPRFRSIAGDARASAGTARERWATPAELDGKTILGAGQYSAISVESEHCPTPEFLRKHPDYLENHPFNGVAIPVRLPQMWCKQQGLIENAGYALHDLVFTAIPLDDRAVAAARNDLRAVRWGHCTENRLWVTVRDGTRSGETDRQAPILTDADWGVACANAAVVAKLARDSRLVGLVVDTEQYTNYRSGEHYPFGKFDKETWRQRGRQWIEAVQTAFPNVSLLFFFSWGPEHEPGGWPGYQNLKPFMDGILDAIRAPARIVHGWESTFWYGGRRTMPGGEFHHYPGDRKTFRDTAAMIRGWRTLSANPAKYDRFVSINMAAWVESDPWNLFPGWPTGRMDQLPWSNLALTLAYSESTVWVWSEHTHYPRTRAERNPFLWSLLNQTRRRKTSRNPNFDESFRTDPTRRGWAFDFDMLDAGRVLYEGSLPAFTTETLGYAWDERHKHLAVGNRWPGGSRLPAGHRFERQRRRFFKSIHLGNTRNQVELSAEWKWSGFEGLASDMPSIGLFQHDRYLDDQSVSVRIDSPRTASLRIGHAGKWTEQTLRWQPTPNPGMPMRLRLTLTRKLARVQIEPTTTGSRPCASAILALPPGFEWKSLDEAGVALPDHDQVDARPGAIALLHIKRICLEAS